MHTHGFKEMCSFLLYSFFLHDIFVRVCLVPYQPEKAFDPLELELQADGRNPVCLVGKELETELAFGKAANALNG